MGRMLRRPIGREGGAVSLGRGKEEKRRKGKEGRGDKRMRGKLRKARRGEGQYKTGSRETNAGTGAVKSSKRMGRIKKRKKRTLVLFNGSASRIVYPVPAG